VKSGILIAVSLFDKAFAHQQPSVTVAICLMPSIEERVAKIFAARQITRTDQAYLMSVFASGKISAADEALINKIYEALNAGRLRVVE